MIQSMRAAVAVITAGVLLIMVGAPPAATSAAPKRNLTIFARDTGSPVSGVPRVWWPGERWKSGSVKAIVDDGRGGWFVGGSWSRIGSVDCPNVAHILANRRVDAGFCPRPNDEVFTLARVGTRLYIGGVFTEVGGASRRYVAAVDTRTGTVTGWDARLDVLEPRYDSGSRVEPGVLAILKQRSHVYVWGEFDRAADERRLGLARFDGNNGSLAGWVAKGDFRWSPEFYLAPVAIDARRIYLADGGGVANIDLQNGGVRTRALFTGNAWIDALAVQRRTLYIAGGPPKRKQIISLATDSGRVRRSRLRIEGNTVDVLTPAGSTVYVGGQYDLAGGKRRRNLAAFDMSRERVLPWKPAAFGYVETIALTRRWIAVGCTCE